MRYELARIRPPLAHGRNGGQTQDRIRLGLMTSACLWFHGKLSGGNRRGKELLSLCTQGKKNPVGPHVRRGWRVVACVRGKSKEWFQRNELAFLSCGSQFLSFSCDPPESQTGRRGRSVQRTVSLFLSSHGSYSKKCWNRSMPMQQPTPSFE